MSRRKTKRTTNEPRKNAAQLPAWFALPEWNGEPWEAWEAETLPDWEAEQLPAWDALP